MNPLNSLREERLAARDAHRTGDHHERVASCDRCHPEQRRFWDDSYRIITMAEVATNLAESCPTEAADPVQVGAYADDCADDRGALDEVMPLPASAVIDPDDVLLAPSRDDTFVPVLVRGLTPTALRQLQETGRLYILLNGRDAHT